MAELSASVGSVERGCRPVVILQNNIGNFYAPTLIVAPITSRKKRFHAMHYTVPPTGFLKRGSTVMLEQILLSTSANAGGILARLRAGR